MILSFFCAFIFSFTTTSGEVQSIDTQNTVSDSLGSNFILRVEDFFDDSHLHFFSMDRMSAKTGSRYYGFEGPKPQLILDGIPFRADYFGTFYSQLLPQALPQINRIEIQEGVGTVQGIPRNSASLHFISEPLRDGISVFLSGQTGHNTGEPGPWVYDPESVTPNVERFGPWGDAGLALKVGPWYARGIITSHTYKRLDVSVQNRIKSLRSIPQTGQSLDVDATNTVGLAETGWKSDRLDVRLQATRTEGKDFYYFHPLGKEVPAVLEAEQYSAFAAFQLHDVWSLQTVVQHREHTFLKRRNQFRHEFGLSEENRSLRASTKIGTESNFIEAGTEIEQLNFSGEFMNKDHQVDRKSLFMDGRLRLFPGLHLHSYQNLSFRKGDHALQSNGGFDIDLMPSWNLLFQAGYSELFPDVSNPLDYKIANGYTILEQLNIESNVADVPENSRLTTFSFTNQLQLPGQVNLTTSLEMIRHLSLNIPFQPVDYSLSFNTFPGEYQRFDGKKGQRFYADISIEHLLSDRFKQQLSASLSSTIEGDEVYKEYWKTIPAEILRYRATFKPYPDLELMLNIKYRSSARWSEFENIDGELNRSFFDQIPFQTFQFSSTTPRHLNVDARVSKWFWKQKLRGVLLFKNVLNRDLQYHPIGVIEDFGFMARVEMRF